VERSIAKVKKGMKMMLELEEDNDCDDSVYIISFRVDV